MIESILSLLAELWKCDFTDGSKVGDKMITRRRQMRWTDTGIKTESCRKMYTCVDPNQYFFICKDSFTLVRHLLDSELQFTFQLSYLKNSMASSLSFFCILNYLLTFYRPNNWKNIRKIIEIIIHRQLNQLFFFLEVLKVCLQL